MAGGFKAVGAVRKGLQTDTAARGAQSGCACWARRSKGVPAAVCALGFGLNASLWRGAVGSSGSGRDPTREQMRCRGRRRRPRPAGPALCRVLSSHRGGTGRLFSSVYCQPRGHGPTPSHETDRLTGLTGACSPHSHLWTRRCARKDRALRNVLSLTWRI